MRRSKKRKKEREKKEKRERKTSPNTIGWSVHLAAGPRVARRATRDEREVWSRKRSECVLGGRDLSKALAHQHLTPTPDLSCAHKHSFTRPSRDTTHCADAG
jgi:hypothetical protein